MFKNIYYNTKTSKIHLWDQVKGKDDYDEISWVPYVFENDEDGEIKSIEGTSVSKKTFRNYNEYYMYVKEHPNCKENILKPEIQFLAERYHKIPDDEIENPKLKVYSIDIEVNMENEFPKAEEAKAPVVLISVYNLLENKTTSFGVKEYKGKYKNVDWFTYIHCKNEETLLQQFFSFMYKYAPDVITGWNVTSFDLQYLVNRSLNIFGEDSKIAQRLSPINNVRTWMTKEEEFSIDIAGITILDYLDIYKWYSPAKLERYTLDYVSNYELEKGKVDYSKYKDLRTLYDENWDLYVEYNVIDAYRVGQLEEKLGYIKLVQTLSLLCKCPMKFYHTQTALIEAILITYFRRNKLCAPTFYGGIQEGYPAAYVKEPITGLHKWVIDLDIVSSYPTAIITLNMSNETYYGRILGFTEDQLISHMKNKSLPEFDMMKDSGKVHFGGKKLNVFNEAIKKKLLCVAPCGSVFSTSTPGIISTVEKSMFYKRVEVKKKMNKMKKSLSELAKDDVEKTKEKIARYHGLQNALKIILNSTYGILAVPFSRYFNTNIAEAIVSCGRQTIRASEKYVNNLLNSPNEALLEELNKMDKDENKKPEKNVDYILYMDTDSLFINLGGFFTQYGVKWEDKDDNYIMKHILGLSSVIEEYVNDKAYREMQRTVYNSTETDFRIKFKQEIIAKSILFVKKKKYSAWHINEEGATVDRIKTTGLEIVRSDTPEVVRPVLKDIMSMILKNASDSELSSVISKWKKDLQDMSPEALSTNVGIHNIKKYIGVDGKCVKGTPMHVKSVVNYRSLLKMLKLENKYEDIVDGSKVKVIYLKKNKFGFDSMAFTRWPNEFNKVLQIDTTRQIEKTFLNKCEMLLEVLGKTELLNIKAKESLGLFF